MTRRIWNTCSGFRSESFRAKRDQRHPDEWDCRESRKVHRLSTYWQLGRCEGNGLLGIGTTNPAGSNVKTQDTNPARC